ncbi:hypothetical protein H1R20_g4777, partial [Candolleomyces eurysporus]
MASSYHQTASIEPMKETIKTESKATTTAADTKANNDTAVAEPVVNEPKLATVRLDGDDKADTQAEEDEDPTYSDDEDLPDFEGGQTRGIMNNLGYAGARKIPRPERPGKN